ncbi:2-phosphosulfolactate phosphatase [Candidatus Electronema sp. JM]|uniref:2-phosphosulfolactate phosphatase n=1 Tax=Candidatus Electronema sp. JM TaxID=3401571 RepID=UPI003AA968EF
MKILKTDFIAGARAAEGIAVIIDVFRAFSTACYCLNAGAQRIVPVSGIDEALALKEQLAGAVLVGERGGKKLDGFDFGNSPTELLHADLRGKPVIQTTHAGTQGVVNAAQADEVLTGAFVNAKATARHILSKKPAVVTLVRMGWQAETPTDEDNLCAEYLESLLLGRNFAEDAIAPRLKASPCSARFFDPAKPWSPSTDFDLCLRLNCFDFAVAAERAEDGLLSLRIPRKELP